MDDQDYAELLVEEAKSDIVAIHEFTIQYEEGEFALHCFYEGDEDSSFYNGFIRAAVPGVALYHYVCGGKRNVVDSRGYLINNGYDLFRCAFFVDRDYDDFLGNQISVDDHTYLTDFYSIESYIVNRGFTEAVLRELCGVRDKEVVDRVVASVDRSIDTFCLNFRTLAIWMVASKNAGLKVNFNNANLSNYFAISGDGVTSIKKNGFLLFKRATGPALGPMPQLPVYSMRNIVRQHDRRLWMRGKYLLWAYQVAFRAALSREISRVTAAKKQLPREKRGVVEVVKMPASLQAQAVMEIIGGRLDIPVSLQEFLREKAKMLGIK